MKKKQNYKLTKEEVLHLARLVRLKLTSQETETFRTQLSDALSYVENLNELNTDFTETTSSTASLENIYFADGIPSTRTLSADEALSNAAKKHPMLFVVPRIL